MVRFIVAIAAQRALWALVLIALSTASAAADDNASIDISVNGGPKSHVTFYARGGSPTGHAFIVVTTGGASTSFGLFPANQSASGNSSATFGVVPITIVSQAQSGELSYPEKLDVTIDSRQLNAVNAVIANFQQDAKAGVPYALVSNDCVSFVSAVGNALNLNIPDRTAFNSLPQKFISQLVNNETTPVTVTSNTVPSVTYVGPGLLAPAAGTPIAFGPGTLTSSDGAWNFNGTVRYFNPLNGSMTFRDGTVDKGSFESGTLLQGTRTLPNGTVESGTFENGHLDSGKIDTQTGDHYEGHFFQVGPNDTFNIPTTDLFVINGHGKFRNDQGLNEGEMNGNKLDGQGQITTPDGWILKGGFILNHPDGAFEWKSPDGTIDDHAVYSHFLLEGPFTDVSPDVTSTGTYLDSQWDGPVTSTYRDGTVVNAQFSHGAETGQVDHLPSGTVETDQYSNGVFTTAIINFTNGWVQVTNVINGTFKTTGTDGTIVTGQMSGSGPATIYDGPSHITYAGVEQNNDIFPTGTAITVTHNGHSYPGTWTGNGAQWNEPDNNQSGPISTPNFQSPPPPDPSGTITFGGGGDDLTTVHEAGWKRN